MKELPKKVLESLEMVLIFQGESVYKNYKKICESIFIHEDLKGVTRWNILALHNNTDIMYQTHLSSVNDEVWGMIESAKESI